MRGTYRYSLTQKDGYDYLVTTSLWSGQGVCYYDYNVLSPLDYSFDRYHNELKGAEHYDPQFFTGLESWMKEDSLLLAATDIDMPQGQEAILTTDRRGSLCQRIFNGKKTTAADRGNRVRIGSVFPERYKSDKIGSIRIFSV